MLHVSCKFGNDIQKIKVIATILVKYTKKHLTMKKVHSHTLECIVTLPIFHGYLWENGYSIKSVTLYLHTIPPFKPNE